MTRRCGSPATKTVELSGELESEVPMCWSCHDETAEEYERLQLAFKEMLALGLDRWRANRVMCELIERGHFG